MLDGKKGVFRPFSLQRRRLFVRYLLRGFCTIRFRLHVCCTFRVVFSAFQMVRTKPAKHELLGLDIGVASTTTRRVRVNVLGPSFTKESDLYASCAALAQVLSVSDVLARNIYFDLLSASRYAYLLTSKRRFFVFFSFFSHLFRLTCTGPFQFIPTKLYAYAPWYETTAPQRKGS